MAAALRLAGAFLFAALRLARGLVARLVRSTVDSFHHPRAIRHARGPGSPTGFYRDSTNLDALATCAFPGAPSVPWADIARI